MPRLIVKKASTSEDVSQTVANELTLQTGGITIPANNDVLSGRGKNIYTHPGNVQFLALVKKYEFNHVSCPKSMKPIYAKAIYSSVRKLDPPGRFLKAKSNGAMKEINITLWVEMSYAEAIQKIRQAMRDHDLRRQKIKELKKTAKLQNIHSKKSIRVNKGNPSQKHLRVSNISDRVQPQDNFVPVFSTPLVHKYWCSGISSGFPNHIYGAFNGQMMDRSAVEQYTVAPHSIVHRHK